MVSFTAYQISPVYRVGGITRSGSELLSGAGNGLASVAPLQTAAPGRNPGHVLKHVLHPLLPIKSVVPGV